MGNDSRITETIVYLYTYSIDNHLIGLHYGFKTELQYSGKIEIQKRPALFRNPQGFAIATRAADVTKLRPPRKTETNKLACS